MQRRARTLMVVPRIDAQQAIFRRRNGAALILWSCPDAGRIRQFRYGLFIIPKGKNNCRIPRYILFRSHDKRDGSETERRFAVLLGKNSKWILRELKSILPNLLELFQVYRQRMNSFCPNERFEITLVRDCKDR